MPRNGRSNSEDQNDQKESMRGPSSQMNSFPSTSSLGVKLEFSKDENSSKCSSKFDGPAYPSLIMDAEKFSANQQTDTTDNPESQLPSTSTGMGCEEEMARMRSTISNQNMEISALRKEIAKNTDSINSLNEQFRKMKNSVKTNTNKLEDFIKSHIEANNFNQNISVQLSNNEKTLEKHTELLARIAENLETQPSHQEDFDTKENSQNSLYQQLRSFATGVIRFLSSHYPKL